MSVLTSSISDEWITPPEYADASHKVMGGIMLDPATSDVANRIVRASKYLTVDENGLNRRWEARTIFVNPPYGKTGNKSNQEIWARKMLYEYASGNFVEGIFLSRTVPGYAWFDWLFHDVRPTVCITRDRIAFIRPEWVREDGSIAYPKGQPKKSKAASAFWYIGEDDRKFTKVFSKFGRVIPGICTGVHK